MRIALIAIGSINLIAQNRRTACRGLERRQHTAQRIRQEKLGDERRDPRQRSDEAASQMIIIGVARIDAGCPIEVFLQPKGIGGDAGATARGTAPQHPMANHLYIHALEASPWPERALPSAERLLRLVPWQGHLVHMPAHIFIHTGDHELSARANELAIGADEEYFRVVPERAGAALTTTGRASTAGWRGSGQQDGKVYDRNQRAKAPQESNQLKSGGYGLGCGA